jgi:sugar/nucleoside kinase (ribokinase family)
MPITFLTLTLSRRRVKPSPVITIRWLSAVRANQAVAAGRSGADIAFIACTGDDDIGERVRRQLESDKIDVAPVRAVAGESTGVALIFVNAEGENVIGIHAGANAALRRAG